MSWLACWKVMASYEKNWEDGRTFHSVVIDFDEQIAIGYLQHLEVGRKKSGIE